MERSAVVSIDDRPPLIWRRTHYFLEAQSRSPSKYLASGAPGRATVSRLPLFLDERACFLHKLDNVARTLLRTDRIVASNSDVAEDQRSWLDRDDRLQGYRERTCKVSSSGRVSPERISFLDSAVGHPSLCTLPARFPWSVLHLIVIIPEFSSERGPFPMILAIILPRS